MTKRKILTLCAAIVATGSLLAPAVVFAHDGEDHTVKTTETRAKMAEETQKEADRKREEVKQQTEALRERVKTQREEVKTKLDEKRLDACKKRQTAINRVSKNSSESASKHLATFQNIEARVKEFVSGKNLAVENYDALVAAVDEKEAAAVAAISVAGETTFSCETTDPAQPGGIVRGLMQSQHQALKDYRTAIKNLIVAVKHATEKEQS